MNKLSYAKLPSAGLGNLLFVWARACIFAEVNNCDLYVTGWSQLHIGTLLRKEKSKRFYGNYFVADTFLKSLRNELKIILYDKVYSINPTFITRPKRNTVYIFDQVPHWANSFEYIKEHREFIKKSLFGMITQSIKTELAQYPPPAIAVHIRRGDFAKLSEGVDFKTVGATQTPLDYFVYIINGIREYVEQNLEVQVFSDGKLEELQPVLKLENIRLVETKYDLTDLLLMSKSKVLITSAGSTFSYWAGFLSDAAVILHHDHIHAPHRDDITNKKYYEGAAKSRNPHEWDTLLKQNLKFFFN